MKNYCVEALQTERKKTTSSMLVIVIIILSMQVFFTFFFRATLYEENQLLPPIVYYLLLLITISIQVFFIRNCIKKWRNVEDTGLIKSIRSQLPVDICDRELDYIFNILNIDFDSTQKNIGKYCVGNKWFMGVSYKNESIAILYNNIKRYEWTTIRKGDKDGGRNDIKGLIVTCIYPQVSYTFGERKTHDVYEYLKEILPEKDFTKADAIAQVSEVFQAMKDSYRDRKNKKDGNVKNYV